MSILSLLQFRPARHSDIPELCRLLEELFTLESDFQPDHDKQRHALQLLIDSYKTNPEQPRCMVWVAEFEGQAIGMCSVQVLISTAEGAEVGLVEDVIIDATYRGQGIGQGLLYSIETWARERGLARLQLLAAMNNNQAIAFYEKNGWCRTQMFALRKTTVL